MARYHPEVVEVLVLASVHWVAVAETDTVLAVVVAVADVAETLELVDIEIAAVAVPSWAVAEIVAVVAAP